MPSLLSLEVDQSLGAPSLIPVIDGNSLVDLVSAFETEHGHQPAGAYTGLVPAHFDFGDLRQHYLGTSPRQWPRPGYAWLLGCDCGEVGCWPLEAQVELLAETISWTAFTQPHRPGWDYNDLGPFRFDRGQYERAITEGARAIDP